jgi:hypothetical protein
MVRSDRFVQIAYFAIADINFYFSNWINSSANGTNLIDKQSFKDYALFCIGH